MTTDESQPIVSVLGKKQNKTKHTGLETIMEAAIRGHLQTNRYINQR